MRTAAVLALLASAAAVCASDALPDFRFRVETLFENIPQPMELKLAPDGRLFFNEYGGKLKIYHPDTRQIVEAGQLDVFTGQENGFLGFALDPKFAENGFIYCLHSPKGFEGQYLSRFVMHGDTLDVASAKLVLSFPEQRKECCHHAGSMAFAPDGCLLFTAGDNTDPFNDSNGYAPLDQRAGREPWDGERTAGSTDSFNGKILRIRPTADGGYEIPPGNLFPKGTPKTKPEIFVMGCRNPWRMTIDSATGFVYWGEVGPDAGDDGPRGSRGYDEINQARKAGNFGWPFFVGNNFTYTAYDYETKQFGKAFDPLHPLNSSVNNTGLRELPPAQPAMIWWPYRKPVDFPELGEGGRTACAGPVFHYQPSFEKSDGFPKEFDGCLLFWDWQRPFIRWARLDKAGDFHGTEPFTGAIVTGNQADQLERLKPAIAAGATLIQRPIDAVFAPDGSLYVMDYGETWGANADAKVVRITYVRGNLPPVAKAAAEPATGKEPLRVKLNSAGSKDFEGAALKYEWRLKSGGPVVSTAADPEIAIAEPGNYRVELRVSDPEGAVGTASVAVVVGNTAPVVAFAKPQDGDFYTPGQAISYAVTVTDAEDGSSVDKPGDFALRTLVSSTFLHADGKITAGDPGFAMVKSSDCFNCHAIETKIIGPAFVDVATKYRGQPGALEATVQRVRNGSSKVWGEIPMLAHPQHTVDELAIMVRWVYSLEKGKGGPSLARGLTGQVTAPKDDRAGTFRLEATASDAGHGVATSLSGRATVTLHSRRAEAEFAELHGPKVLGTFLGSIDHGHTAVFPAINLAEVGAITARVTSPRAGSSIEFHAGAADGPLIATVAVPNTGGWDKWVEQKAELAPGAPRTRSAVVAVFINPGQSGIMNLDWVQFDGK
ncbi:MAG: PQQ-dependent sugar dehydrogenase [Planctomycetes bacterium]|nr:PQQ-dependent sugar dehydrogenase [Planctomycetota bacterium]